MGQAPAPNLVFATVRQPLSTCPVPGPVDTPPLLGSALANGKLHLHSSIKRKLAEEKGYVFDKRLRHNVRQNESNCRFRDIVVRKEEGFTHVLLSTQTTENNALTPEVKCTRTFHSSDREGREGGLVFFIYYCIHSLYLASSRQGFQNKDWVYLLEHAV